MIIRRNALCLAGLLAAGSAQAQVNVGELLDLGGRKMAAAEVLAMGETRLRSQRTDADADLTLRADGTVVGRVENKQGHGTSEAVGHWRVDAAGQRCIEVALPAFRMDVRDCAYLFRLGQDVFFARSDADPEARLVPYVR
jgi:hypothetical protein